MKKQKLAEIPLLDGFKAAKFLFECHPGRAPGKPDGWLGEGRGGLGPAEKPARVVGNPIGMIGRLYAHIGNDAKHPHPNGSQVLILISEIRITDKGSSRLRTRGS